MRLAYWAKVGSGNQPPNGLLGSSLIGVRGLARDLGRPPFDESDVLAIESNCPVRKRGRVAAWSDRGWTEPKQMGHQLPGANRFVEIGVHSQEFRVTSLTIAFVAGHHDNGKLTLALFFEMFQYHKTAHARHHHVEDHQIRRVVAGHLQTGCTVLGCENKVTVIFENDLKIVPNVLVVIDH